ncbi:9-O-acetylesterase, partial [bacterium]|nr:9-O-acetylesterase [bacterium]
MHKLVLCLALSVLPVQAKVLPHPLFTDGAVLQRDCSLPVWGTADEGEQVTVSLGDQVVRTVTRDGHWRVSLQARPAGGPYTLTIQGENKLTFNNLMYG